MITTGRARRLTHRLQRPCVAPGRPREARGRSPGPPQGQGRCWRSSPPCRPTETGCRVALRSAVVRAGFIAPSRHQQLGLRGCPTRPGGVMTDPIRRNIRIVIDTVGHGLAKPRLLSGPLGLGSQRNGLPSIEAREAVLLVNLTEPAPPGSHNSVLRSGRSKPSLWTQRKSGARC